MGAQRHIIGRQVIEIRCRDPERSRETQAVVGAMFADRIAPAIARSLDAVGVPQGGHRLDRLEVDLGVIRVDRLVDDLQSRIGERLPPAVCRALTAQGSAPRPARSTAAEAVADATVRPGASALALIAHFAETGRLPWWGEARRGRPLADAIAEAAHVAPAALGHLLRGLASRRAAVERLVRQLDDRSLATLVAASLPAAAPVFASLVPVLARLPAVAAATGGDARLILWREAFASSFVLSLPGDGKDVLVTLLTAVTGAVGVSFARLLVELQACLAAPTASSPPPQLAAALDALFRRSSSPDDTGGSPHPQSDDGDDGAALAQLARRGGPVAPLAAILVPLWQALPDTDRRALAPLLAALSQASSGAPLPQVRALADPFVRSGLVPAAAVREALAIVETTLAAAAPARDLARGLDAIEGTYVENAGLVLLWPFLPRFFTNLGLTDDGVFFRDEAARHRGVGLLHYVATGERQPPEYWLVLNKVLCGMEVEAVHAFSETITDVEAAEAGRLLDAVLAHGTAFGELSRDGLRGTFLLRRGALATRDGAFLLRVERKPWDVVLDRLPWLREWVRLPWMQTALRVEW